MYKCFLPSNSVRFCNLGYSTIKDSDAFPVLNNGRVFGKKEINRLCVTGEPTRNFAGKLDFLGLKTLYFRN